jgi:hypothetical protein
MRTWFVFVENKLRTSWAKVNMTKHPDVVGSVLLRRSCVAGIFAGRRDGATLRRPGPSRQESKVMLRRLHLRDGELSGGGEDRLIHVRKSACRVAPRVLGRRLAAMTADAIELPVAIHAHGPLRARP